MNKHSIVEEGYQYLPFLFCVFLLADWEGSRGGYGDAPNSGSAQRLRFLCICRFYPMLFSGFLI